MLTPLPWRRPWKVASQVATDLPLTGEELDTRTRADMMDEGIDLVRALWAGHQEFHGRHYDYRCSRADLVEALRQPRPDIPIWVVGVWPRPRSMQRVLKCDGVLPQYDADDGPAVFREVKAFLDERADRPIDLVSEGETPADDPVAARDLVRPWADAGATWWLETRWEMPHHSEERMSQIGDRIAAGPPPTP